MHTFRLETIQLIKFSNENRGISARARAKTVYTSEHQIINQKIGLYTNKNDELMRKLIRDFAFYLHMLIDICRRPEVANLHQFNVANQAEIS